MHRVRAVIAYVIHMKWVYNFLRPKVTKNVNFSKNGFYHRILQASEYLEPEDVESFPFFETLVVGLVTNHDMSVFKI